MEFNLGWRGGTRGVCVMCPQGGALTPGFFALTPRPPPLVPPLGGASRKAAGHFETLQRLIAERLAEIPEISNQRIIDAFSSVGVSVVSKHRNPDPKAT